MVQLTLNQLIVLLLFVTLRIEPLLRRVMMRRHLGLLKADEERGLTMAVMRGIRVMLVRLVIRQYFRVRERRRGLRELHEFLTTLAIVATCRMVHPELIRMDGV